MKFILIRGVAGYQNEIADIAKPLIGNNIKVEKKNNDLVIYHNYENDTEIKDMLYAIEASYMVSIYAYLSFYDTDEVKMSKELEIAIKILDLLPVGVYTLKDALIENPKPRGASEILDFILEHTSISEHFIKGFIESDLNVSKAAKEMSFHRNTMIYKLDKLKEVSGFDLRCFKDAYILYSLVSNK